ncbi:MAG TPA: UvrD-helicase domain-containing protein [Treponema sp.]|nr:UvrD-helicase domain-containing protein [Treponema sp.]
MNNYQEIMQSLDKNQFEAATISKNAVIAAGAGSGKTRVLAARYIHLIVERGFTVDQILTLTFTTKAAAEMYSRIHTTLRETDHPNAKAALDSFHLAKIQTIDSFSNAITRSACRNYGVSPDFSIEADQARHLAETLALPFFLEHRSSKALGQLLKKFTMADLPSKLFVETMIRYSPLSAPLDFTGFFLKQSEEMETLFPKYVNSFFQTVNEISRFNIQGATFNGVQKALETIPEHLGCPDYDDREGIIKLLHSATQVEKIRKPGNVKQPELVELKESLKNYSSNVYFQLLSVCNFVLNREYIVETLTLLDEFQDLFNEKKRQAGILTFTDVARMAVDALIDNPDLRAGYKENIKAIMIDEFQDDNELQKDLLFLLAEKEDRREKSLPKPTELCPDKLFFVGDEKQSIYRFRGADVSVFRSLARDLGEDEMPRLDTNYRTEKPLLNIFNTVFPKIFLPSENPAGEPLALYEARFAPIEANRNTEGISPHAEIQLVFTQNIDEDDPDELDSNEAEAEAVARKIAELIQTGFPVRDGSQVRPVRSDDIAILFRSGTRQYLYEQFLREYNIPSQSESLRGLFADAPINDLYVMLRLAVFPTDASAYAAFLRSPFVAVSDEAFVQAMLDKLSEEPEAIEPFCTTTAEKLTTRDRQQFDLGKKLYDEIREKADRIPTAELISDLWYRFGYRYSLVSNPSVAHFTELYDYFFELARQADERNEPIAIFLDSVADFMDSGEKVDGLDIPIERSGGVRLMTVHKSKGLEFPVVFLVDAANVGNRRKNTLPVYFSNDSGISINTGSPDDAEEAVSNWFFEKTKEEDIKMDEAELRRLLYVAMTRAETALFISGKTTAPLDEIGREHTADEIRESLTKAWEKRQENAQKEHRPVRFSSFLDLLLPAVCEEPISGLELTEIGVPGNLPNAQFSSPTSQQTPSKISNQEISTLDEVCEATYPRAARSRFPATALPFSDSAQLKMFANTPVQENDRLNRLIKENDLTPAEFGTLAHRVIESHITGLPVPITPTLLPIAQEMADRFFSSTLGTMAKNATWRDAEYGFITRMVIDGRKLTITGQIDLVFEHNGILHIVDYKTDSREIPEEHQTQLSIYTKAITEIHKKPVKSWIYYLRTGNVVAITEQGISR